MAVKRHSRLQTWLEAPLIALNILCAAILLLACLIPYVSPQVWWWTGFAGLAVPYLVIILVFTVIFWLIVHPRFSIIGIVALLIAYKPVQEIFAWHAGAGYTQTKSSGAIRLVDWNVANMSGMGRSKEVRSHSPGEIAASILRQNPDIICLQEFNHSQVRADGNNIGLFTAAYPYHYFSRDYDRGQGEYQYGVIIFSRFPIIDSGRVPYPGRVAESLIWADILRGADTLRVFTSHLQSYRFKGADYQNIEKIRQQDPEMWDASKNLFQKMKVAFSRRGVQADIVRTELDKCPHASVICGDFNDVPASYAYSRIRGYRQDAFLRKGFGIGRTFVALMPTLRIDHILPDARFEVRQMDMVDEGLSDHLMLVCDLGLTKKDAFSSSP